MIILDLWIGIGFVDSLTECANDGRNPLCGVPRGNVPCVHSIPSIWRKQTPMGSIVFKKKKNLNPKKLTVVRLNTNKPCKSRFQPANVSVLCYVFAVAGTGNFWDRFATCWGVAFLPFSFFLYGFGPTETDWKVCSPVVLRTNGVYLLSWPTERHVRAILTFWCLFTLCLLLFRFCSFFLRNVVLLNCYCVCCVCFFAKLVLCFLTPAR